MNVLENCMDNNETKIGNYNQLLKVNKLYVTI